MRDPVVVYPPGQWGLFARELQRALRSERKSKNTIFVYLRAVRLLGDWTPAAGVGPLEVQPQHIRAFMAELIERTSPGHPAHPADVRAPPLQSPQQVTADPAHHLI